MATLRASLLLFAFIVLTLVGLPLQFLSQSFGLPSRRSIPLLYHRLLCRIIGVRVLVIGTPVRGGVLMAANHTSWLDIPILSTLAPLSFVAKTEVGSWAFFGTLARLQNTVFVRRNRAGTKENRDLIRERLKEGGTLVIFPEGTSSDGNRVLPFKSALLSAADLELGEQHVPVQPVSVAYVRLHGMPMGRESRPFFAWYGDMELVPHLWEAFAAGPVDVVVELHEPLTIDEAGGRKALAQACEAQVRAGLVRALSGPHIVPTQPHQDEALMEALGEAAEAGEEN